MVDLDEQCGERGLYTVPGHVENSNSTHDSKFIFLLQCLEVRSEEVPSSSLRTDLLFGIWAQHGGSEAWDGRFVDAGRGNATITDDRSRSFG